MYVRMTRGFGAPCLSWTTPSRWKQPRGATLGARVRRLAALQYTRPGYWWLTSMLTRRAENTGTAVQQTGLVFCLRATREPCHACGAARSSKRPVGLCPDGSAVCFHQLLRRCFPSEYVCMHACMHHCPGDLCARPCAQLDTNHNRI